MQFAIRFGLSALALASMAGQACAREIPVLAKTKQLFLDDHVVASLDNVTRTIHPAVKFAGNPVLTATEPWEGGVVLLYGSVLEVDGQYRMWYYSGGGACYAESEDGIAWRKPELGIIDYEGRKTNWLINREAEPGAPNAMPYYHEMFGVHADPRDAKYPFKMGFLSIQRDYEGPRQDPFHGKQRRGLGVAGSADGLHWEVLDGWATEAICDGATHWMYDPARRKYVLYGRTKHTSDALKQAGAGDEWFEKYHWGRAVARVESPDFLAWDFKDPGTAPVVMEADPQDPIGCEVYSMLVFPYEGVYIGLIQRFHNLKDDVFLDVQLAVSHDSVHFEKVGDRTPFIPCGGVGQWDRYNNSIATNPPIAVGDELRFYYAGRTYRHGPYKGPDEGVSGGAIGFASIQRDRFVSLSASFDGGQVTTKPMKLDGALHLNAKADFGEILVEVLGKDGKPIARSKPVEADALDATVEWDKGDPASTDEPVSLRFTLMNALLYAFWCE